MNLTAYLRVSTNGQVDKYGLPAQETDVRAFAKRHGHRIVKVETDGGLTGTLSDDERPALLAALRSVRDGRAEGILIPSLNRLARLLTVQEAILAKVWQLGGKVFAADTGEITPDDPDDPMRTAMRQMAGVFAQLDRAMLVKRMRNGRAEKARRGGYAGYGSPAFGQQAKDGELVPDETESAVVARIAELRASGASLRQIAAQLAAEGSTPKRGGSWHPQTVARVLARL